MFVRTGFVGTGLPDAVRPAPGSGEDIVVDPAIFRGAGAGAPRRPARAAARVKPVADWDSLSEPLQLMLAGAALRRAAATIAFQAETLAQEMKSGALEDRGGPDALRLLAAIVRVTGEAGLGGPK
jgi:hypothetical protein